MFSRLFLLLVLLPLCEILLLAWIGVHTSWLVPVVLVLGTGLAGAWVVRWRGWQTQSRIRADLAAGRVPSDSLLDGLLVLVAGLLLILPGVLSDLVAVVLLLPVTRTLVKRYVAYRFGRNLAAKFSSFRTPPARHDEIIDVRVIESPRPARR